MGAGLWMASRVAKEAVDEGRKIQSSRQQEIVNAMKMAMQEANDETVDPITSENEPLPPPTETNAEKLRNAEWSALVNDFLTERLLAIETSTTTDDASTSLESRLHRIVAELDAEIDLHPAVKSAIRIRVAESYLKLMRNDDAAVQCQKALDLLERTYSIKHSYSIRARQNLAVVRLHQGEITEAALLYQQLHEIRMVEN